MRGAAAAVQQSGRAEDEGAGADAQHACSALHGPAQGRQRLLGVRPVHVVAPRGHGDEVGLLQAVQIAGRTDGETGVGPQEGALGRHDGEVVDGEPLVGPVEAEHLAQHPEFEGMDVVEQQGGDILQHDVSVAAIRW